MMEVAGLVITVMPLMISALKQYTEARRGLRQFRRTSLYLSRLIQALREQKFLLETDLQQLLRAAGSEDDIVIDDHGDSQAFVLKVMLQQSCVRTWTKLTIHISKRLVCARSPSKKS